MGEITAKLVLHTFESFLENYEKVDPDDNLDRILQRQLPKIWIDDTSKTVINKVNEVLKRKISSVESPSIEELHTFTYCAAKTVAKLCETSSVFDQAKIPTKFPDDENGQKRLFRNGPKIFGRLLFEETVDQTGRPREEDIKQLWSKLWEEETHYRSEEASRYIQAETDRIETRNITIDSEIRMSDLKKALKTKKNWSPPGIDGLQNFWYKRFTSVREVLLKKINDVVRGREEMPEFFTVGFTELHAKDEKNRGDASNYRPITHLPAIYKIITRCVYQKLFQHYEKFGILADEQCGGRKDCYGVRKALVIDSIALNEKEVHGCYVDFRKAFDSIPHDWILKMLRVYKVDENLVKFIEKAMGKWRTRMHLKPDIFTTAITLKRGVFQGDPTSVILFWTALNPVSFALQNSNAGPLLTRGGLLSHVFYMDDLKLYASNSKNLQTIYEEVKTFADAIAMTINVNKTKKFSIPGSSNDETEVTYLGYVQIPKIKNDETIYRKVRKFESRCAKIASETKISEDDKNLFKKKFVFNAIFSTFGILHWRIFKRELLKIEVRKKFLLAVQQLDKDLSPIYLKLINDMCKMRRKFIEEGQISEFIGNIVKNDNVTPLQLSITDEKEYVKMVVTQINEKKKRKRKASQRE